MGKAAVVPVRLTELERRIVRLRDTQGMKWTEIARRIDRDPRNVQKAYQQVQARIMVQGVEPSQEARQELQEACDEAFPLVEGKIDDKLLSEKTGEVAWKALWRLLNDPVLWERATLKELAAVYGTMIDKRQLLRGEPTNIVKIQDIRKLDEMAALLHEEMERRGLIIDVTPEKIG